MKYKGREQTKSLRVIGESSRTAERSSSRDHVSLAHEKSLVAPFHASDGDVHAHDPHPKVGPTIVASVSFLGDACDMSLLPFYTHHTSRHT